MVRRVLFCGVVLGAGLLLAAPGGAQQQDTSSQPKANESQSQPGSQKKDQKKSTAQENPFPEQKSEAAAKQVQQQEQREDQDAAPSAPAPQAAPGRKTADQNPFPEAQSEKAAHQDEPAGKQGFSSSQVKGLDLPGANTESPAGRPSAPAYDPKLAKKDTQVGMFYLQTGDFKGAYDRFVEAARTDPGNADAVYGLGESALRLGKNDVALRNFRLYLSALPDGPHAKEIRRAMKKMGVEPPA
jgi:tetratricopeptide (TPR) repeat protein